MDLLLKFLKKLKSNNNREWFEKHRPEFDEARTIFQDFCEQVISGIRKFDKQIGPDITAANSTFRIYRDVRFSKDKTPYKTHMSASINPGGKKSVTAGYYLHIQPGESFIAGGVWMPEPVMLQAIRQEIDYQPQDLMKILRSATFKKYFKGFDEEGKLKTVPKGYDKDHPHIDLLRNRHFIVSHEFSDKVLLSEKSLQHVVSGFKAMYPLMQYLRTAQDHQEDIK